MAKWLCNLHLTHGDIVRIAPDELSFANGAAWKDIYSAAAQDHKAMDLEKRHWVTPGGGHNTSIVGAPNEDHPRLRRALLHPFSERALHEMEPLIRRHLETLVSILRAAKPEERFDMVTMYNHAAFDIMSDYAFDEPLHMQTSSQHRSWVDSTFGALWEVSLLRMSFYYPWTSVIVSQLVSKSTESGFQKNYQHCVEKVNKRLAAGPSPTGLLGRLMSLREEFRLTPSELHVNLQTLMVAGTETSAALLASVTYYLLRNPKAMQRLQEEVRSAFPTAADINQTALKQMPYLHACIEESLRLQPPVPVGVPRAIPTGGALICGEALPEKVVDAVLLAVHIAILLTKMTFRPSCPSVRWLSAATHLVSKIASLSSQNAGLAVMSTPPRTSPHSSLFLSVHETAWEKGKAPVQEKLQRHPTNASKRAASLITRHACS